MCSSMTLVLMYINPSPANVENMVSYYCHKWQMRFNSAFKGLNLGVQYVTGTSVS